MKYKKQTIVYIFFAMLICMGCNKSSSTNEKVVVQETASPQCTQQPVSVVTYTPSIKSFYVTGPTATPTPKPTPTPSPTPVPTPTGLLGARYDGFSYDGFKITDSSYYSENLAIEVYTAEDKTKAIYSDYFVYHVADIHLQNIADFRTASAGHDFRSLEASFPNSIGKRVNALLACTGDYYVDNKGLLIRNGILYKNYKGRFDICVLYRDGTIKTFKPDEYETKEIIDSDPWQVWSFGPSLLNRDGSARSDWGDSQIASRNPRCILGYYEPGHYALIVIDGRQSKYSMGLTLDDLAKFCQSFGFSVAYNLDGGKTAAMCWQGKVYSKPENGGRSVSDIIYFCQEE